MDQRDARTALRFVQIRRGDEDRDALLEELRQQLPEFAPRDRVQFAGAASLKVSGMSFTLQRYGASFFPIFPVLPER